VIDDLRTLLSIAWQLSPGRLLTQLALLLAAGVAGGISMLLLIPIVNSLTSTTTVPGLGIQLSDVPLPVLLAGFVVLVAISAAITRSSTTNAVMLNHEVVDRLRADAFTAILGARWTFVLEKNRSDVLAVVATGASRAGLALSQLLSGGVTLMIAVVTAAVALIVQPALSAIAIAGTLVLGAVLATSVKPAYRIGGVFSQRTRALQSAVTDSLDSLRLVRAHDAAGVWEDEVVTAFGEVREVQIEHVRRASAISALSQVGLAASASLLVLLAVWLKVPAPTIIIVLVLVARLARSVQFLAGTAQQVANSLPAVADIRELTQQASAAQEHSPRPEELPPPVHGAPLVALREVCFHYPNGGGGLTGLSLEIPTGRITALTGPSGAGKSTTADFVLGLLTPDAGEVLIEGWPLTDARLHAWRARIGYVPQETLLVPGTLRHNLTWSVGDVDDATCWQTLDRCAAGFARDLPEGLDTMLGDRGVRLSGGERQRIAIARALLRNPDLLVLDEATSALDDLTEAEIMSVIAGLTPAVTVLLIAHRASTVEVADHVVRLGV
jgi:ATP-binding cassette subfamily C protein